jgi:pheromone alpha factor receptor
MVPTVVAVFLPLSGMWASAQTDQARLIRSNDARHRQIPVGATNLSSAKAYGTTTTKNTVTVGTSDTLVADDKDGSDLELGYPVGRASSSRVGKHMRGSGDDDVPLGVEAHELKNDVVVVDRTYSVRSD